MRSTRVLALISSFLLLYTFSCVDDDPVQTERFESINYGLLEHRLVDHSELSTMTFHRVGNGTDDTIHLVLQQHEFDTMIISPSLIEGAWDRDKIYREHEQFVYTDTIKMQMLNVHILPSESRAINDGYLFYGLPMSNVTYAGEFGQFSIGDTSSKNYNIYVPNLTVEGKEYTECFRLVSTSSVDFGGSVVSYGRAENPDYAYYNAEYGLIKINLPNGEVWTRLTP
ncbi:MAG: hypothetical protein H6608_07390 [Flavobacteriales bacterium]|nr:hypothetical protein [Bacteroidota bacterium]MCB9240937.1 hypothetical protein [Flavobacteriales bacterium]